MAEEKRTEEKNCSCNCDCNCDCCKQCCEDKQPGNGKSRHHHASGGTSQVHVNDSVGAIFLGILAVMLLIFLVRSNKRNRELLLEVIELRRQA